MRRQAVGFEGGVVVVEFRQGEDIGLVREAGDFKAAATRFLGAGVMGGCGHEADEFIHAVRWGFDGDDEGGHGGRGQRAEGRGQRAGAASGGEWG